MFRRDVQGEGGVGYRVEQTVVDHEPRAVMPLLTRLEHEHDRAGELVAAGTKRTRRARQHGDVSVVAAGVHRAARARSERQTGVLDQRQGVHVAAQQDGAAVGRSTQDRHDAAGRRSLTDLEREARESRLHLGGRLGKVEAEFGFGVDRAPQPYGFLEPRLSGGGPGRGVDGHGVHGGLTERRYNESVPPARGKSPEAAHSNGGSPRQRSAIQSAIGDRPTAAGPCDTGDGDIERLDGHGHVVGVGVDQPVAVKHHPDMAAPSDQIAWT